MGEDRGGGEHSRSPLTPPSPTRGEGWLSYFQSNSKSESKILIFLLFEASELRWFDMVWDFEFRASILEFWITRYLRRFFERLRGDLSPL